MVSLGFEDSGKSIILSYYRRSVLTTKEKYEKPQLG
jgi:hypothetical protein